MSLNFSQLAGKPVVDTATEPRRSSPPYRPRIPATAIPRDVQTEIWEGWHPRRYSQSVIW